MNRLPTKRFTKGISSSLTLLASFALLISLNDKPEIALAADDPAATVAKSPQAEPPDVLKQQPAAKDQGTAKRSAEQIGPASSSESGSIKIETDAPKVSSEGGAIYPDSEMIVFHATAYCLKGRTATGIAPRPGMIAADPSVLPMGTVVHIRAGQYTGTYTVTDTGGRIKGRRVDVYVPTYREAVVFGRRQVKIKVLGKGRAKPDRVLVSSEP